MSYPAVLADQAQWPSPPLVFQDQDGDYKKYQSSLNQFAADSDQHWQ